MSLYRDNLPQMGNELFLTDGGMETTLYFIEGIDLPGFAAFPLLKDAAGRATLEQYFDDYLEVARRQGANLLLESATWRANADWGHALGYGEDEMEMFNRRAIDMLVKVRNKLNGSNKVVISGNIGPRGDGYDPSVRMSADEARDYHATQIRTFADTEADMVCALTINYVDEAVGIIQAARDAGMPVAMAFTVETDGRLPSGDSLQDAIEEVDRRTDGYAAYFMINCAHPTHFSHLFTAAQPWQERIRGIRANASCLSHAELDESETLDDGNPQELGDQMAALRSMLPNLTVLGGCCGTDHRHIDHIGQACGISRAA